MNLRIALKIWNAIDTPDQSRYNDRQIGDCHKRMNKTQSQKSSNDFWNTLVAAAGIDGRVHALCMLGQEADALNLMLNTPMDKWGGCPEAAAKLERMICGQA